ncbi:MAG: hypothetical protein ACFFCW_45780 [Candidatus Hodarchaeota archaeon]
MKIHMDPKVELKKICDHVGPENIWRNVYDQDQTIIARGKEDMRICSPNELAKVDFIGKTVVDLGCNFGFYSFLIKNLGAKRVVGVDNDFDVIKGCHLLKEIHSVKDIDFLVGDFITCKFRNGFHIGMLINIIGKNWVLYGIQDMLDNIEQLSLETMVISARHFYNISKHLKGEKDTILTTYGPEFIKGDQFMLMDFIGSYFKDRWNMTILSGDYDLYIKSTLLFTRRQLS